MIPMSTLNYISALPHRWLPHHISHQIPLLWRRTVRTILKFTFAFSRETEENVSRLSKDLRQILISRRLHARWRRLSNATDLSQLMRSSAKFYSYLEIREQTFGSILSISKYVSKIRLLSMVVNHPRLIGLHYRCTLLAWRMIYGVIWGSPTISRNLRTYHLSCNQHSGLCPRRKSFYT